MTAASSTQPAPRARAADPGDEVGEHRMLGVDEKTTLEEMGGLDVATRLEADDDKGLLGASGRECGVDEHVRIDDEHQRSSIAL